MNQNDHIDLTVLMADLRGFTTASQSMLPKSVIDLLNIYFMPLREIVEKSNGELHKYLGDGFMAVFRDGFTESTWGKKEEKQREHQARAAVEAACLMQKKMKEVNRKREQEGLVALHLGIGINSDAVVKGSIDKSQVSSGVVQDNQEYIGDGINVAARIESANKKFHSSILISGKTFKLQKGSLFIRHVGLVKLPGRKDAVELHEVLEHLRTQDSENCLKESLELYTEAMESFREENWSKAQQHFQGVFRMVLKHMQHSDKLSELYFRRCAYFMRMEKEGKIESHINDEHLIWDLDPSENDLAMPRDFKRLWV